MSVPIERIDPDDLLLEAGRMQDNALSIEDCVSGLVDGPDAVQLLRNTADQYMRCAGYIRFLETLAFQPDGETWKEIAEARGKVLAAEAEYQRRHEREAKS